MDKLLNISLIILISLIPILLWGFIFSYINWEWLNRKRFFVGIIAWVLGVLPILYMEQIYSFIKLNFLNIFYYLGNLDSFSIFWFSISLELFLVFLAILAFLLSYFIFRFKLKFSVYLKNIFVFFLFIFLIALGIYFINFFDFAFLNKQVNEQLSFWNIVFKSLKLVIFYYLIVAFIEEASKHFNFLSSSLIKINSISQGVLYAIYIALGFALFENILYFYHFYSQNGLSFDFVKLYFYRSIFTIITHIFASSLIAFFFTKAYLLYKEKSFNKQFVLMFWAGIFYSILAHLIFDVSLTLGFNFIIILYLVFGYLYVSFIFFRE